MSTATISGLFAADVRYKLQRNGMAGGRAMKAQQNPATDAPDFVRRTPSYSSGGCPHSRQREEA